MLERLLKGAAQLGGVLLLVLASMITVDVFVRWITGRPIIGVFEIAEILLLVTTFLAMGLLHYRNRELRVDLLSGRARGVTARVLSSLDSLLALAFFALLLWSGIREWQDAVAYGAVRRGLVEIPSTVPIGGLVIGVFLTCLALLRRLVDQVRGASHAEGAAAEDQGSGD